MQWLFARLTDQAHEFLRCPTRSGLSLGAEGEVAANDADAGVLTLLVRGGPLSLSRQAAATLLVAEVPAPHARAARPRVERAV